MSEWSVTINVGGGPGKTTRRVAGMARWAEAVTRGATQAAVVFAQEVPSDEWLQSWRDAGYTVTQGVGTRWPIRSALITREDLHVTPLNDADVPSLGYHGSYVAAARWHRPQGDVVLASAHASPNPAEPSRYGWPQEQRPEPAAREGGGDRRWRSGILWDSDMLLATLLHIQQTLGPVIAGGDFNESRLDDHLNGQVEYGWGHEYFALAQAGNLIDISLDRNGQEIPTRGSLQLDHVLASTSLLTSATDRPEPHVDPAWQIEDPADLSDHAALWVPLPIPVT